VHRRDFRPCRHLGSFRADFIAHQSKEIERPRNRARSMVNFLIDNQPGQTIPRHISRSAA
jgi:hypothetical protein